MRNIKVLPHRTITPEANEYNVRWGEGIYTKRMAMQLYWRMSLLEHGALQSDAIKHNADGSRILIQLEHTDHRITYIHSAETVISDNGIEIIRGFHWEADTQIDLMALAPDNCDRYLTKGGMVHYDVENLENKALQNPNTFVVPEFEELAKLVKGDFVQLYFHFNGRVERMWVKYTKCEGFDLVGTLANDPVDNPYLRHGTVIKFHAHHIAKIIKGGKVLN